LVVEELQHATSSLYDKMFKAVETFSVLTITDEASVLAQKYVEQGIFPEKYYDDALHVAIASVNDINVLLSWNFTHLVKLKTRRMVSLVNSLDDYLPVEIISPPEL